MVKFVAISLCLLFAACAETSVRKAPFRVRPDAPQAGSLEGPFNGRVLDSTTHQPVAGALVYGVPARVKRHSQDDPPTPAEE